MAAKKKGSPRALRNADVTGMTERKQADIAKETGEGSRKDAAERFIDEQEDQASTTSPREK